MKLGSVLRTYSVDMSAQRPIMKFDTGDVVL